MGRDSVLGKDMEYEQLCKLRGSDGMVCWNEYGLLCKLVYNNENGCVTWRLWKFLNEIHRNGIPRPGVLMVNECDGFVLPKMSS